MLRKSPASNNFKKLQNWVTFNIFVIQNSFLSSLLMVVPFSSVYMEHELTYMLENVNVIGSVKLN